MIFVCVRESGWRWRVSVEFPVVGPIGEKELVLGHLLQLQLEVDELALGYHL